MAVAASLPATGQEAPPAAGQEEIIVTGSRVSRSGFDSSQPLTTIDSQQIENLGLVNVGDVVRTLPQNTPFFTETNVGIGNFNVGAQLANLRGLNPFFGTRTLTLIDTRRVVPTTEGGAVDLTLIPSMLVERTLSCRPVRTRVSCQSREPSRWFSITMRLDFVLALMQGRD